MKKFITILAVGLAIMTTSLEAEAAKRFGGGISFGRPAPSLLQKAPAAKPAAAPKAQKQTQQAKPAAGAAAAAKPASPWRGMLMGAAAALGITALLHALGLSEGFAEIVMMMLVAMVIYYVVRMALGYVMASRMGANPKSMARDAQPRYEEPTHSQAVYQEAPRAYETSGARPGSVFDAFSQNSEMEFSIPKGFDKQGFEKVAKDNFIALQKAWDTGSVNDISDFVTDDLFVAITHQLRERGRVSQVSEVINLQARLLGIGQEGSEHIAIVAFDGAMKISGEFEEVKEHWILTRPTDESTGWLLAGIEQVS